MNKPKFKKGDVVSIDEDLYLIYGFSKSEYIGKKIDQSGEKVQYPPSIQRTEVCRYPQKFIEQGTHVGIFLSIQKEPTMMDVSDALMGIKDDLPVDCFLQGEQMSQKEKPCENLEEESFTGFSVGDLVVLKSGSPTMTVEKVEEDSKDKFSQNVTCCWYNMGKGSFTNIILSSNVLTYSKSENY